MPCRLFLALFPEVCYNNVNAAPHKASECFALCCRTYPEGGKTVPKTTILIPAMLDFHFPLLRYAFSTPRYTPVILEDCPDAAALGLEYAHNDLCYPAVLIIGQMLHALGSGKYDLSSTVLMIPQAGDACRGSNYLHMIRKALQRAGYGKVPILSLNLKGLEEDTKLHITPAMIHRAVNGALLSDLLMLAYHQTLPYQQQAGEAEALLARWRERLGKRLQGSRITQREMKALYDEIALSFAQIPRCQRQVQRIGMVGGLYVKYCSLGNCGLVSYLHSRGCEVYVNGLSWYALYYLDTHIIEDAASGRLLLPLLNWLSRMQTRMVESLRNAGFQSAEPYDRLHRTGQGLIPYGVHTADGWLISWEAVQLVQLGIRKVLCVQPFGCMPNHIGGKGMYPNLQRHFPQAHLVSVDYDTSGSLVNVENRIQMLLDAQ